MATQLTCESFTYNADTANYEWPRWLIKFNMFIAIQKLRKTDDTEKMMILNYLVTAGGDKVLDQYLTYEDPNTIVIDTFIEQLSNKFDCC